MSDFVKIFNDGPEIVETNYFNMDHAARGYCYLSINTGAFRLLVPDRIAAETEKWRSAREVIVSRGPWPDGNQSDAIEILFEDDSKNPHVIHISNTQVAILPLDTDRDRKDQPPRWIFTAWTREGKQLTLPCRYRLVKQLPWLKPF